VHNVCQLAESEANKLTIVIR